MENDSQLAKYSLKKCSTRLQLKVEPKLPVSVAEVEEEPH
jgi:hypothetical protein